MRLVAISGIFTLPLSCSVTHANAARGTLVAMVGMRGLVPADAGVQNGDASGFQRLRQLHHFIKSGATFHQVQHGQAEDDDEVGSYSCAGAAHNLQWKAECGSHNCRPIRRHAGWFAWQ